MKRSIQEFSLRTRVLLRSVSPLTFALFILAVFAMNLLANKSLDLPFDWLALDCGIIVSWVAFLCMDVLTRHYGPVAATTVSLVAIAVNLLFCLILYLSSLIPGTWGAFFDFGELPVINEPDICAYGLKAAYDPRAVLEQGKERYLAGPVIVYGSDFDGDSISLDAEEVMAAIVYFAGHTVKLCADGADLPAFIL